MGADDVLPELSGRIIGAAIEVHRHLGPGLLERVYESCLCEELAIRGISFVRQLDLPVVYKGRTMDCTYRIDVLVEGQVVLELKSVNRVDPVVEAQLLTYMRLGDYPLGLILNFNVPRLRDGIVRRALRQRSPQT